MVNPNPKKNIFFNLKFIRFMMVNFIQNFMLISNQKSFFNYLVYLKSLIFSLYTVKSCNKYHDPMTNEVGHWTPKA